MKAFTRKTLSLLLALFMMVSLVTPAVSALPLETEQDSKTKLDPSAQGFAAESALGPVFRSSLPWKWGGQSCDDKESVFG